MRAAVYDPAAPQGARLVERAAPNRPRVLSSVVLCEVGAAAQAVDAKYVIGDKFELATLGVAKGRRSTPGSISGVVIQAPAARASRPATKFWVCRGPVFLKAIGGLYMDRSARPTRP